MFLVLFRLLLVALVFLRSSSLGDAEHVGDGVEEVVEPVPAIDIECKVTNGIFSGTVIPKKIFRFLSMLPAK